MPAKKAHSGEIMGLKFDNHVSIGNILAFVALIVAGFSWGTKLENAQVSTMQRVETIEKSDAQQDLTIESIRSQTSTINTSIARVQERLDAVGDDLKEIKDNLFDERPRARSKKSGIEKAE